MVAAIVVLIAAEGSTGLTLTVVGLVGAAGMLAGGYWFIAKRGVLRWIGLALATVAVVLVIVVSSGRASSRSPGVTWPFGGGWCVGPGGVAPRRQPVDADDTGPAGEAAVHRDEPPLGGGKVVRFDLKSKAEALGAKVALLDGPGYVDVAGLVRDAVADGADLLGVAGGDGTQALVAGIAAEHDIPLLVISAGTRNHFALDLGLDRDDPSTCLDALTDGEEVRVDLGHDRRRPFVNNASFGAYAEIVQSPEYRDNKNAPCSRCCPTCSARTAPRRSPSAPAAPP